MNHGNLFLLAAHLDSLPPDKFRMWDCNYCISGHANRLAGERDGNFASAAKWLGISMEDTFSLFIPRIALMSQPEKDAIHKVMEYSFYHTLIAPQAARLLRHYAITGKIDWTAAFAEEPELPKAPVKAKEPAPHRQERTAEK